MSRFRVGDRVRKTKGYPFSGTVCAVYETENKCCVKHIDKWEHIFSDDQLTYDHPEYQYLDMLKDVVTNGVYRQGRNGGTYGVFGRQIRFDLNDGFPLLTTKKVHFKSIAVELLWFLRGDTNIKYLNDNGVSIWNEWADVNGDLGPVYGSQWRSWPGAEPIFVPDELGRDSIGYDGTIIRGNYGVAVIDQISNVIKSLKEDPNSRRHIVSAWNPALIDHMALPPCHCLFQFFVSDNKLSCHLYQRSADIFLGVPFNIASYALLTQLIAREVGLGVGEFIHTFGDLHIYENHLEQAAEQLINAPLPFPYVTIETNKGLFDLEFADIKLHHYNSHPGIKASVSV